MSSEERALPVTANQPTSTGVAIGQRGLVLRHLADAWHFARCVAASGLAPRGLEKPEAILVAMQFGMELGLSPMQAIQSVAVINGRPCVYGDTMLALCMSHPDWLPNVFHEWFTGKPYDDDYTAHCRVGRRGRKDPVVRSFSIAQAKRARLLGKDSPWQTFPDRMLQMRARSFALRDTFPDVLRGVLAAEELIGIVQEPSVLPDAEADKPCEAVQSVQDAESVPAAQRVLRKIKAKRAEGQSGSQNDTAPQIVMPQAEGGQNQLLIPDTTVEVTE